MTFGDPPKSDPKSDFLTPKVTQKWLFQVKKLLLGLLLSHFEGNPESNFLATFESLGQILYTHLPPLKIHFLGWGAYKEVGGIKFLPRGASKYTPWKMPSGQKWGEGGRGAYIIFPWILSHFFGGVRGVPLVEGSWDHKSRLMSEVATAFGLSSTRGRHLHAAVSQDDSLAHVSENSNRLRLFLGTLGGGDQRSVSIARIPWRR